MAKRKTKPPHEPSKATRDTVQMHSMVGTPQEDISRVLGIDAKTLRKYYRNELDLATAKANAQVGGALFNKAVKGDTAAAIFWLKTKAGFRETQNIDHTTKGESLNRPASELTDDELAAIIAKSK